MKLSVMVPLSALTLISSLPAEVPLLSPEELREDSALIVVGQVRAVYSTTDTRGNYEDTNHVTEMLVADVEKGTAAVAGEVIYAHSWNRKWIGEGRPEPHSGGHHVVAAGDTVRAHLKRQDGVFHVLLPNGFVVLDAAVAAPESACDELQGRWQFVYCEENGDVVEPGTREFVISGEQLDFRARGESRITTTVTADDGQFDQTFPSGDVYRSVYRHLGDVLILCGNRNRERPSAFRGGTENGGEFFIVLRRVPAE